MTLVEAVTLGIVQGATEFLPISSTAHLRILPALAGWDDPGAPVTAVLQIGTLAAVVGYFMPDFLRMARASLAAIGDPARRQDQDVRILLSIIIGTLPIVVAGIALKDLVHGVFRGLPIIAGALIAVALGLLWAERHARHARTIEALTIRDGFLIGCAQVLALVPGTSRSGITLLAALLLGFRRGDAARYSFLLSVPAVAGAGIFELPEVMRAPGDVPALVAGVVAAAATGYLSIAWLLRFLRTRTTRAFAWYRIALGALLIGFLAAGLI